MMQDLENSVAMMLQAGKGILAADESNATIQKRFKAIHLESTENSRRDYREMLFRAKDAMQYISSILLYEETLYQNAQDGTSFVDLISSSGVLVGIKVDRGLKPYPLYPGEHITVGLDDLDVRLKQYKDAGARVAKWRVVLSVSDVLPSMTVVKANMHILARYAVLCQNAGLVPIVEPEVLMEGDHTIERCAEVTEFVLRTLFNELYTMRVCFEGLVLKSNMILPGKSAPQVSDEEIASNTIKIFKRVVPCAVQGIAFLSGGQSEQDATARLSAMNSMGDCPWRLSFSYGRALQESVLRAWNGKQDNVVVAQRVLSHRAHMNSLATKGCWKKSLENSNGR
ncbi:class I fructose-bisphosphate aldolase [Candidatus Liberibacter asiaticus]|uniref:Probable fructose-bisphosphate aldolase class 1 n=1 Tax=Liberibacter asiaticus (strain psy62) TaxID=537021 RepID=C6XFH2_LIBAP|nr:class I fructose-bisphosphate aldolase [Candidatus Liberibacter asiaticus]ACT57125.1 Fructose-bisphosphate aldolase [Candidatus Liberibacter asiaticus str. psy62]KAE9510128.1 fructose-1,6-bisphosphate aldolase [Candidatus Liberibacter asiaticus]KAE9510890.1 fructose-1,6-bisphosphate aldolase [Candidatus Liberibacter asiaticus]KAE9512260.1 fructose-1,6-bisphosphate aldolase [Candidatus Liberibacter asiaticus]KAE9513376.1 fructose-1,6-bisphosphate aldolase [Candidatus Liberibacter asiaticus]